MKKLQIKNIELKDKAITRLSIWLNLKLPKDIEDWTVDDQLLVLSLKIQRDLIFKRCNVCPNDLMAWRQNISKAITETTDKYEDAERLVPYGFDIEDEILTYLEGSINYETYAEKWGGSTKDIGVVAVDDEVFAKTPKGQEDYKKAIMFQVAKAEAKAEAKRELEAEQKDKQEAYQQAKDEVIVPFENYGK